MPLNKELINRIKAKMDASGIKTIVEFAEKSGVQRQTLTMILDGNVETVKLSTLKGIAKAFGCTVSSLLDGIC